VWLKLTNMPNSPFQLYALAPSSDFISSIDSKCVSRCGLLSFGNSVKSHGAKSGDYGRCGTIFWRNGHEERVSVRRCIIVMQKLKVVVHNSGLFRRTALRKCCTTPRKLNKKTRNMFILLFAHSSN